MSFGGGCTLEIFNCIEFKMADNWHCLIQNGRLGIGHYLFLISPIALTNILPVPIKYTYSGIFFQAVIYKTPPTL